jgi:hypothetical protein
MAVWHTFLKLEKAFQTIIIVSSWLQLLTGWAALPSEIISVFLSMAEKPSEDTTCCLFSMTMKGLMNNTTLEQPLSVFFGSCKHSTN